MIDATDATLLAGLAREVEEETGLRVTEWEGPLYEVRAIARRAGVVDAVRGAPRARVRGRRSWSTIPTASSSRPRSPPPTRAREFLASCAPWVREPLADWIEHRWGPSDARAYTYDVFGTDRDDAPSGAHV